MQNDHKELQNPKPNPKQDANCSKPDAKRLQRDAEQPKLDAK